ncbi:hypothetical protein ABZX39_33370 [Streptomyces collinus]|uniref:hypothetical protein n=1 Tax=Streptomyces collinus TaxID=42684 RepID=UPI0033B0B2A9
MTSPAPSVRPAPPLPTCAPAQIGPCAHCRQPTHRYGHGGNPLCPVCLAEVEAARAQK